MLPTQQCLKATYVKIVERDYRLVINKELVAFLGQTEVSLQSQKICRTSMHLFVKHFMMGPGQKQQCVGCSLEVDHVEGILDHLENHDVSYAAVARAPIDEIEAVRKRMDWHFPWVSSYNNDFNYDFNVSFKPEDMAAGAAVYNYRQGNPGMEDLSGDSIFYKDDSGHIFHTYSTFGRGGEEFLGIYRFFDLMPKGRDENGPHHSLADWARPHNMYGKGGMVEATGRYHSPGCACAVHK